MKRAQTVFMALLLLAGIARAQSPPSAIEIIGKHSLVDFDRILVVKEKKLVIDEVPFKLRAPDDGGFLYIWELPAGVVGTRSENGRLLEITATPKGAITIGLQIAVIVDGKGKTIDYTTSFLIGGAPPVPLPPPTPPDEKPKPKPPVPASGLRVLVVAEATNGALLFSKNQVNELYGEAMANYARAKLAKGPDGSPEIRRIDRNSDVSQMNDVWKQFFSVWQREANGAVPWIIISNGATGFSGPLPDTGLIDLIKRYELP